MTTGPLLRASTLTLQLSTFSEVNPALNLSQQRERHTIHTCVQARLIQILDDFPNQFARNFRELSRYP
jgi:hypothetical protein